MWVILAKPSMSTRTVRKLNQGVVARYVTSCPSCVCCPIIRCFLPYTGLSANQYVIVSKVYLVYDSQYVIHNYLRHLYSVLKLALPCYGHSVEWGG